MIIIHNEVGASIFSRKFGQWNLDTDLIGGFLTAIQSFGSEIKQKTIPIKRMEYQEFEILMEQGKHVIMALLIDEKESDWMRQKLGLFLTEFEKEYESVLIDWSGELFAFKNVGLLVDKVFELYRI